MQDRLVKELRLRNISTVKEANIYLEEFIKEHNNKFAKPPIHSVNVHRDLQPHMLLDEILCFKTLRTVSYNLTFQYNRKLFLLEDNEETRVLRRKQIALCEHPEGHIKVFYQNQELKYRIIYDRVKELSQGEIITDNKYLTELLEYAQKRQQQLPSKRRSSSAPTRTHLQYIAS